MKTFLTEYDGYACEDIEAPYWEWAEDLLEEHIRYGRMPPGTEVFGELQYRNDTVTNEVEYHKEGFVLGGET